MGQAGIQERSAEPYRLSLDDQLNLIAEQRYDATRAYEPTYKAVFIAKLTENSPHIVQRYSSQELQEIAAVYAYWYADEDVYNPEGKALQKIETLQNNKHEEIKCINFTIKAHMGSSLQDSNPHRALHIGKKIGPRSIWYNFSLYREV